MIMSYIHLSTYVLLFGRLNASISCSGRIYVGLFLNDRKLLLRNPKRFLEGYSICIWHPLLSHITKHKLLTLNFLAGYVPSQSPQERLHLSCLRVLHQLAANTTCTDAITTTSTTTSVHYTLWNQLCSILKSFLHPASAEIWMHNQTWN